MLTSPVPSVEETRANSAFEALIWALSRPGRPRDLPGAGEAVIIDALLDRECRVFCADPRLVPKVLESGAVIVEQDKADHVFLGAILTLDGLKSLSVGTDLYPDDGATVVIRARIGAGDLLRLTGPGVDGEETISVGGLPHGFWAFRRDLIRYPMGFDLFLVDGAQVLGLPRSTNIEVL